jgi:hypothetical protein
LLWRGSLRSSRETVAQSGGVASSSLTNLDTGRRSAQSSKQASGTGTKRQDERTPKNLVPPSVIAL